MWLLWRRTQLAPSVLSALPSVSASCLQREDGDTCGLKLTRVLLTSRAPYHSGDPEQFFFLPLKEGKGHPKCHMSWLGAKFQWPLSPRAMLKLTSWAQTERSCPLCGPRHLHRSAAGRLLAAEATTQRAKQGPSRGTKLLCRPRGQGQQ